MRIITKRRGKSRNLLVFLRCSSAIGILLGLAFFGNAVAAQMRSVDIGIRQICTANRNFDIAGDFRVADVYVGTGSTPVTNSSGYSTALAYLPVGPNPIRVSAKQAGSIVKEIRYLDNFTQVPAQVLRPNSSQASANLNVTYPQGNPKGALFITLEGCSGGDSGTVRVRVITTSSCSGAPGEDVSSTGGVTVAIGNKRVTTGPTGVAEIDLPRGKYGVAATWNDSVLGFVNQGGNRLKITEDGLPNVSLERDGETLEIRMLTCGPSGEAKARAVITDIGGSILVKRSRASGNGFVNMQLRDGDTVTVRGRGKINWLAGGTISFDDAGAVTTFVIGPMEERPVGVAAAATVSKLELLEGIFTFFRPRGESPKKDTFEAGTGTIALGVDGTEFTLAYDPQRRISNVTVKDGVVRVTPKNTNLPPFRLQAGQGVQVSASDVAATRSDGKLIDPSGPASRSIPVTVSGRWTGSWSNSNGDSGTSTIIIAEGAHGEFAGEEDGTYEINSGFRSGNILTWEYRGQNNGCLDYKIRWEISPDGATANGTYTVTDRCARTSYTGKYTNYRRVN